MPSTSRCGVDNALPKLSLPVRSSKTAISVKVPPISAASRTREPFLFAAVRRVIVCLGPARRGGFVGYTFIGTIVGRVAPPAEGIAHRDWALAAPAETGPGFPLPKADDLTH